MRKFNFIFLGLFLVVLASSCKKDELKGTKEQSNISELLVTKSDEISQGMEQSPFEIHSAGIYQQNLYLSVSYEGGEETHLFQVGWDEQFLNEDDKRVMEFIVYHPKVVDEGGYIVYDSIISDLSKLDLPAEELANPDLWVRVINSTLTSNQFMFLMNPGQSDPSENDYKAEVKVVKEGCIEYGLWGELWLVTTGSEEKYFFVNEIDESINYNPVENDILSIKYNWSYVSDSSAVCNQLSLLGANPVEILELEKR